MGLDPREEACDLAQIRQHLSLCDRILDGACDLLDGYGRVATIEGAGLAYTFEQLALPHIRARKLQRVLSAYSPTFPGFYLYYSSRRNQSAKLQALIDDAKRHRPGAKGSGLTGWLSERHAMSAQCPALALP